MFAGVNCEHPYQTLEVLQVSFTELALCPRWTRVVSTLNLATYMYKSQLQKNGGNIYYLVILKYYRRLYLKKRIFII